jgi:hypothetical protein
LSYIDDVADAIRRRLSPDLLPPGDTASLFRLYALLVMAKGEQATLGDVRDAWSAWMSGVDPHHPSLRPLAELSAEIQRADEPYLAAIQDVARDHTATS